MFTKLIKSKSGSALVYAFISTSAIVGTFSYLAATKIPQLNKMRAQSNAGLKMNISLSTALDYTKYAILNRWCLTNDWQRDENKCNWTHAYNTERLLLNYKTAEELTNFKGIANPLLTSIPEGANTFHEIDFSSLASTHPLTLVLGQSASMIKTLAFRIERVSNSSLPTSGEEAYIRVIAKITLQNEGSIILNKLSKTELSQELVFGAYPRELNTFAFIAKGDLVLAGDKVFNQNPIVFPAPGGALSGKTPDPGITFLSPVFSNENVIIPSETEYSPITFADTVVLGEGQVYRDGKPYEPPSAGGNGSQYFADIKSFGGFLRGVRIENEFDAGLNSLFGVGGTANTDLMQKCINYNKVKTDLRYTANSHLLIAPDNGSATATHLGYTIGLGGGKSTDFYTSSSINLNIFQSPNSNEKIDQLPSGQTANLIKSSTMPAPGPDPIVKLEFDIAGATGDSPSAWVGKNGKWQLELYQEDYIKLTNDLTNAINQLKSDKKSKKDDCKDFTNDFFIKGEHPDCGDSTTTDCDEVVFFKKTECKDLIKKIEAWASILDSDQKLIDDLNDKIDAVKTAKDNPVITVTTQPVKDNAGVDHISMFYLAIDVSSPEKIPAVSSEFKIKISAFDVGTNNQGINIRQDDKSIVQPGPYIEENKRHIHLKVNAGTFNPVSTFPIPLPNVSDNPLFFNLLVDDNFSFRNNYIYKVPTLNKDENLANLENSCKSPDSHQAFSYGENDFTNYTKTAWNVRPTLINTGSGLRELHIHKTCPGGTCNPAHTDVDENKFHIYSIQDKCIIKASTEVVAGFLVCNQLIFEGPRTTRLQMVGTFIVGQVVFADKTPLTYGVRISSIYHPEGIAVLKAKNIISKPDGTNCDKINVLTPPAWSPEMSLLTAQNIMKCSPDTLRSGFDNITWTSITPFCGLLPGASATTCNLKFRPRQYTGIDLIRGDLK